MPSGAFPLFEAPFELMSGRGGPGPCVLCSRSAPERLRLGIGVDVIVTCGTCDTSFAVDSDDHKDVTRVPCPKCETAVRFPELGYEAAVCFDCFRSGRAAQTHDTEYGMVRWEDAVQGRTHGVPGLNSAPGLTLNESNEDGWRSVNVPSELLLDLVHTPSFLTWQGATWQFCCARPMVYVGEWGRADFGDEGRFREVIRSADSQMWQYVDNLSCYIFHCPACSRHSGYYDYS